MYNVEYAKVPPDQLTGLNIWMMNQLGNMTLVTNVIRNTGQLVVFGTAESLSYLVHGKGIFIMIVMLYQFWWLMKNIISFCQVFLPKMSNMSIQSKSKEVVDEENDI